MEMVRTAGFSAAMVAGTLCFSAGARADVPPRPRVPVTWDEGACLQLVDRTEGEAQVELGYQVFEEVPLPGEDLIPAVPGQPSHQFFAFCEDVFFDLDTFWIDLEDVTVAEEFGLVEAGLNPKLLTTAPAPLDCWVPITAKEQRRPIQFSAAEDPVVWDISKVPAGRYYVWGYTWHPPFNIWQPRSGTVIAVHDGDPAQLGPVLAISSGETIVAEEESSTIEGCVEAIKGTDLAVQIAAAPQWPETSATWVDLDAPIVVEDGHFQFEYFGQGTATSYRVRVVATAPDGRTSHAVMHGLPAAQEPEPWTPPDGDGADDETSGTGGSQADESDTGCNAGDGGGGPLTVFAIPLLVWWPPS